MVGQPAFAPRPRRSGVVRALILAGFSLALAAGACNGGIAPMQDAADGTLGSTSSALESATVSFEMTYPAGTGIEHAVIGASASLRLGPHDRVLGADGSPGAVTNTGEGDRDETTSGPNTSLGPIVSVPRVVVGPGVTATSATSTATVTAGPNADLGTVVEGAVLRPFSRKAIVAHAAGELQPDVNVRPKGSIALAPGRYRTVTVGPKGALFLSGGTYVVEKLSLGSGAELHLDASAGTIDVYVRQSASFAATTIGDASRFVLGFLGQGELSLRSGFRGTALAPFGTLALGPGGPGDVYEGTFYGKHVVVGPHVTVRKLAPPIFGADLEGCAARIQVRDDLPPEERGVAYQADIARYCSAPGISSCQAQLIGRANVDYTASAARMITKNFSPAQYLALSRDRSRKLRAAQEDAVVATRLCTAPDSDGDWVIDSLDRCPDTPDLTATDDEGCPVALPPAPSADDVARVLSSMHLIVNPRCQDAPMPGKVPAGAFYWPAFPPRGTYILSGSVQNQLPGCPVWYEFDIEELSGANAGFRYTVVFMDREANPNLVELGRPVPTGFIQFNPRPGDVGGRDRLARTGGNAGIRYRARAMNANGIRGPWSDYKISDKASCTALGFECGG